VCVVHQDCFAAEITETSVISVFSVVIRLLTRKSNPRNLRGHMYRITTLMGRMVMRRPGADA